MDEMRFLRINSNERVLEKPTGSANTVEDGSGIGKSGEGEGEGDEKGDEAYTDDVGVKLADVERSLASSEEIYIYILFIVSFYFLMLNIIIFQVKY